MMGELSTPALTPFAIQELELAVRARKILPHGKVANNETEVTSYINEICQAMDFYGIEVLSVRCDLIAKAAEIREKYGLSYYDSHHAAAALSYDKEIVSTDRQYDKVEGLRRIDPSKF